VDSRISAGSTVEAKMPPLPTAQVTSQQERENKTDRKDKKLLMKKAYRGGLPA
jgi:hypothetical protein